MDPEYSLQDVVRCHLCETPVPTMYCDICKLNLCKPCVGKHLSDKSTEHKIVPFNKKGSTFYCSKHATKLCYIHCKQCAVPICVQCAFSGEDLGHKQADVLKLLESKNKALERDLKELENLIYPKYQEIASNISVQKADLSKHSKKMKSALEIQGENLHREIDIIIKELKNKIDEIESKCTIALDKQENEIKQNISEITQDITNMKKVLNSKDVNLVSSYKSSITKFKRLPPKLKVSPPSLSSQKVNKKQIYQQFGSLSAVSITKEEYGYTSNSLRTLSSHFDQMQFKEEQKMNHILAEQIQKIPCPNADNLKPLPKIRSREHCKPVQQLRKMPKMPHAKFNKISNQKHVNKNHRYSYDRQRDVRLESKKSQNIPRDLSPELSPDLPSGTEIVYFKCLEIDHAKVQILGGYKAGEVTFLCTICNQTCYDLMAIDNHLRNVIGNYIL